MDAYETQAWHHDNQIAYYQRMIDSHLREMASVKSPVSRAHYQGAIDYYQHLLGQETAAAVRHRLTAKRPQ